MNIRKRVRIEETEGEKFQDDLVKGKKGRRQYDVCKGILP